MRSLITLLTFMLAATTLAQDFTQSAKRFRDKFTVDLSPGETIIRTWYHYVVTSGPSGTWTVRVYYPETGRLTQIITFVDEDCTMRKGPTSYWYDDGTFVHSGNVDQNGRTGVWNEAADSGAYLNDKRHGAWRFGQRDRSNRLVRGSFENGLREGLWTTWDSLGRKVLERQYRMDELNGEWNRFDPVTGEVTRRLYRSDSLIEGMPDTIAHEERMPCLRACSAIIDDEKRARCTDIGMEAFLSKNLVYPRQAVDMFVSGKASFTFVVDMDGSISDIRARTGLCKDIEEVCLAALERMPEWSPGTQNGKPVKVVFQQPVRFTLR